MGKKTISSIQTEFSSATNEEKDILPPEVFIPFSSLAEAGFNFFLIQLTANWESAEVA